MALTIRSIVVLLLLSSTCIGQKPQQVANQYFQQGEIAFNNNDWAKSEAYYDSCIQINPNHFEAYHSRAITRENQNDPGGAISDYGVLIHLNPEFTEALWSRAVLRYQIGHYELANEDFHKLLDLPENETNAVYFTRKYPDQGVSGISTLETMRAQIYNYLGLVNHKLKQYDLALSHYGNALRNDSLHSDILVNRSQTYEVLNKTYYAINDLKMAIKLDPKNSIAKYNLARLQEEIGDQEELVETYTSIISDSPYFSEAYAKRGLAKMNSGDLSGALQDYDSAIYHDPKDARIWLNRGIIHKRLGYYDHAYSDFSRAIELKANMEEAYLNRGNLHMKLLQYDKALKDYDMAIFFYSEYTMAFYNRGITNYNLGRKDQACMDIKKSLDLGFDQARDTLRKMCD